MYANPFLFGACDWQGALGYSLVYFLRIVQTTLVFPLFAILLMRMLGLVSSMNMEDKMERTGPFIATGIFYLWTFLNVRNDSEIPVLLQVFTLGATISLGVSFFINIFNKISLHSVAMGGLVAMTFFMYLYAPENMFVPLISVILLAGLVGTARLWLHAHDLQQVLGGFIVGIATQVIAHQIIV